jgi:YVTN family beta-propeller protein
VLHCWALGRMRARTSTLGIMGIAVLAAGCGGTRSRPKAHPPRASSRPAAVARRPAAGLTRAAPRALVSAETENRLLVVALPSGRVLRRVPLPADPGYVTTCCNRGIVVVSARAGKVTLLDADTLRVIRRFGGFGSPHIPVISPDGKHVYVTDDARGTVTVIGGGNLTVTSTVPVGTGAHHMSFSPDQRQLWIALGESARQIAILTTADPDHPRVLGHFDPGFAAHDLSFTPNGRQVWITSASGPDVAAFDVRDHRLLFRVPVGPPPQHVVFEGRYAYVTSGYGNTIEQVAATTGHVIRRARAPYGSFELDAGGRYVVTSSLLRGTIAIYNVQLKLLGIRALAPAARDVAISTP